MRILIVEDNHVNQIVLETMLRKLNIETDIAHNGSQALSRLDELHKKYQTIDAIFMDCQMPIMDGFEATRNIRRSNTPYANIPIIAVTGNVTTDDEKKCLESGMNAIMNKPFQLGRIRQISASLTTA